MCSLNIGRGNKKGKMLGASFAQWGRDSSQDPRREDGEWARILKKFREKENKRSFPFLIMKNNIFESKCFCPPTLTVAVTHYAFPLDSSKMINERSAMERTPPSGPL